MMQYLIPMLAVLAGYGFAFFLRPENKSRIKLLLSFSGSFLLSLTVMHLLPEVYESHGKSIGLFIMGGILFQIVLEFFSKGAEHGHVHGHHEMRNIPWALFISLCLHALLEGFPVSHHHDMAIAIAVHHFPIAIILTIFFVSAKLNKTSIFIFMLAFALMTPLGTAVSQFVPQVNHYYNEITAVVIGILFHISSTIIFEATENHKFNLAKLTMIALGILSAAFL
ncbi:ZIP family metal transporter [Flavobacterium longum]